MACPHCGSLRIRRSLRRGFSEGFFLRLVLRAPYRCFDCGTRYFGSSLNPTFRPRKKHSSIARYLGFRSAQSRKLRRTLAIVLLFAVLIAVAIWIVLRLSEPGTPAPAL